MTVEEVRTQALRLSPEDREVLAFELLSSLDSPEAQSEIDAAWAEEILARSDAYRAGKESAVDWRAAFREIEAELSSGS